MFPKAPPPQEAHFAPKVPPSGTPACGGRDYDAVTGLDSVLFRLASGKVHIYGNIPSHYIPMPVLLVLSRVTFSRFRAYVLL